MECVDALLHAHALAAADAPAAEAICRAVAASEPENGFALHLLGVLRTRQGDFGDARRFLQRAVAARPWHVESRIAWAEALASDGRDEEAARELDTVVAARPGHAAALAALAMVRLRLGHAEPALDLARRAVAIAPDAAEALLALGSALSATHHAIEARGVLADTVDRAPAHGRAHLNYGNVLLDLDDEAAAERHIRRATDLEPGMAEAWASLGFLLAGTDRLDEAVAACDRAIALRPDFAQAYWNRSFAHLRAGDFPAGWADYEWRHRHSKFGSGAHVLPGAEWDGGDLSGRRLLVNATQGFGDTIQLARYLPLLVDRGAEVTLCCPAPLLALFAQLPVRLTRFGAPRPDYDLWIDQMSLPRRFGSTPRTIPAAGGYLRSTVRGGTGHEDLQVGLVCAGNPLHSNDFRRSMRPEDMRPLRDVAGVAFTSLQVGPSSQALARLFGIADLSCDLPDMAATAAIVARLDLVIAVDTAVAHLAGALGVPVWILIPRAPDWRWLAGRDDSPWYASARLFRQDRAGDWAGVIGRVADALARRAAPNLVSERLALA